MRSFWGSSCLWRAVVVLLVVSAGGMNGCCPDSAKGPRPVEIKVAFWGGPDEINMITDIIKEWQQDHPLIKVQLEHTPYRGYIDKLLTRIAGGAAPDIVCTEVDLFVAFQTKGVLLGLNDLIAQDPSFKVSDFFPQVIDRFTIGGDLYAIPRDTAPFACVFYNKALFDEAGLSYPTDDWSWADMLAVAQQLTKKDAEGRTVQYGFYGWAWQNFVYGNGGDLVDNVKHPTRCTLDSPESVAGLQFYTDLMTKHGVMPSRVALTNMAMGPAQMFATGRLALFASGIWETPFLRSVKDLQWDVVMFPKGPTGIRAFGTGGSGYCILKATKHPKEAWEVLKALTCVQAQEFLAIQGLAQPALQHIAKGPAFATDDQLPLNKKMLNDAVNYVIYSPFHTKWREAQALYIDAEFDVLFNEKETAQEAVDKIVPQVNALLKDGE